MFNKNKEEEHNIPLIIVASFIIFYTLYIGANFIIPFIIAVLFSFAIIGLSNFYKKIKVPKFLSMFLSLLTYGLIFFGIWKLIHLNIDTKELIKTQLPYYEVKINSMINDFYSFINFDKLSEYFGLDNTNKEESFNGINFINIGTNIISGIAKIFSNAGIIFFYTMFILLEYRYFGDKLSLMIKNEDKRKKINDIIIKIKNDTKAYFIIKTNVSLITAFISFLIMKSFGLDLAILWALIIFLLNFIPNIGSIIALFFPIMISLVQYPTYYQFVFITSGLIGIQILMGNIIEPKFMGNKLNLSPLAIIISLSFWGALWGIVGMILSVPIMVIINIILAKLPSTKPIAILLSEKGELKIQDNEETSKTRKKFLDKIMSKIKR